MKIEFTRASGHRPATSGGRARGLRALAMLAAAGRLALAAGAATQARADSLPPPIPSLAGAGESAPAAETIGNSRGRVEMNWSERIGFWLYVALAAVCGTVLPAAAISAVLP